MRLALIIAVLGAVTVFTPSVIVTVTGEPFYVDCGGLEPDPCDQAWHDIAEEVGVDVDNVTWVEVQPVSGTCGDYTLGYWWPFIDVFSTIYTPLCG